MGCTSDLGEFEHWFLLPSPGYTVFWVMPETTGDYMVVLLRWIRSLLPKAQNVLFHSTRQTVDDFLSLLRSLDPQTSREVSSMGGRVHFVDSYSCRLRLFGGPVGNSDGVDVRYVTDPSHLEGPGSVLDAYRGLDADGSLEGCIGLEWSLTDLAVDMGEQAHSKLFASILPTLRFNGATIVGIADWYSHSETYKARLIHLSDASILWGVTSGQKKAKYLLPVKRPSPAPASYYEPVGYEVAPGFFRLSSRRIRREGREALQESYL